MTDSARLGAAFFDEPQGAYLDTASIGLVPSAVPGAVAACYDALGRGVHGMQATRSVVDQTRELIAEELGLGPTDVSFFSSTGEAMNALARSITWRSGDQVVVLDDDFPTVRLPWTRIRGVEVVTVTPGSNDERTGAILGAINQRTRVVAVSHVHSQTGTVVDLPALQYACRSVGALLVSDGAQGAGVLPAPASGADFYITTGYKWLLAGFGIAVMVARQHHRDALDPGLIGHANEPPSHGLTVGTPNLAGIYALGAAAQVRKQIGREAIHHRILVHADRIRAGCDELGLATVPASAVIAGIVSFMPDEPAEAVAAALRDLNVTVAHRGDYVRISPHFYTSDSEIELLLRSLVRQGLSATRKARR